MKDSKVTDKSLEKGRDEWKPEPIEDLQRKKKRPEEITEGEVERVLKEWRRSRYRSNVDPEEFPERTKFEPGVIVDPLAFYVPYHVSEEDWGIYFRGRKVRNDFLNFVGGYYNWIRSKLGSNPLPLKDLFFVYLVQIYRHELVHHVAEDIALERGIHGKSRYPLVTEDTEESLCEFFAFKGNWLSQERIESMVKPLKNISNSRKLTKLIKSPLYYHWGRNKATIYKPERKDKAKSILKPSFTFAWNTHKREMGGLTISGSSEVYRRVWVVPG